MPTIFRQLCSRSRRQLTREFKPIPLHTHSLPPGFPGSKEIALKEPSPFASIFVPGATIADGKQFRIHGEAGHLSRSGIEESAVMAKPAIPEEPRQHSQGACRERLVDEGLLPFERLDRRTTGQRVFAGRSVGNLRVEIADRPQAFCERCVNRILRE